MTVKECYAKLGGDYEDVVKRLMGDVLVERFMLKFLDDGSYQELVNALKEGQDEDAFRAAHTLKGVCQNLSFTSLYEPSQAITEALRGGKKPGADELLGSVTEAYERTTAAIREYQAEK